MHAYRMSKLNLRRTLAFGATALAMSVALSATADAATNSVADPSSIDQQRAVLAGYAETAISDIQCWPNVAIKSVANGQYVSAELGYWGSGYGELRARSFSAGGWEQFDLCRDAATGLANFSNTANHRLVSAELGYTGGDYGMLRARASVVGPWEVFSMSGRPRSGWITFKSTANDRYVSAEMGYSGARYGMLRARATSPGPWEYFEVG